MQMQTYVSKLECNNRMIDFERWSYKKVDTIIKKIIKLYGDSTYDWLYREKIEQSDFLVIYKTDSYGNKYEEVKRIDKSTLLKMLK